MRRPPGSRGRILALLLTALLLAPATPAQAAPAQAAAAEPAARGVAHKVTYDRYSFMIDGKRVYLWSGEFHYFRLPNPDLWRDVLEKMKAVGFNTVSLYFSWAYHSPKRGVYDFTGVRDVDRLLDIAEDVGLYVIARPGPYINAEVDAGGYPGWLVTQKGRARTAAPDYREAYEEWLDHVNAIIRRHQITDGSGTVILHQIENEYDGDDAVYMQQLQDAVKADGITVPLFHNEKKRTGKWASGPGAPEIYAADTYPGTSVTDYGFMRAWVGNRPMFWAEFQGGWFQPWGGGTYEENRQRYGPTFERITYGNNINHHFTAQNIYMTYGGTNWGWQADPGVVYTSYDYGAAFSEPRELTEKIPVLKQQGFFVQAVEPLRKTDDLPGQPPHSNAAVHVDADVNPDTGTKFFFVRHEDIKSTARDTTDLRIDVPDGSYTVPQQPGTAITVNGQDYKILVAGYDMGGQRLVYSTSEIMTHARVGDRDVALLHGRVGEAGETVLRYAERPEVRVLDGDVTAVWDAARGDLRLNYTHRGLARVLVSGGHRPDLELLLADSDTAATFWRPDAGPEPVLVRGAYLVRSARRHGAALWLTGDAERPGELEVFAAPQVREIFWNGRRVRTTRTADGSLVGAIPGPRPVQPPALNSWRYRRDVPEADPAFDDSRWTVADRMTTDNPTRPATLPVLYADDYGFHHGDVWYRGHFEATGSETGIALSAGTGKAGVWAVWVNGRHLGTVTTGTGAQNSSREFAFPPDLLRPGRDNVVSVLVRNMGHNEDGGGNDAHKDPRGLLSARLVGSGAVPTWRVQGTRGGEDLFDDVRGPLNNGGLHGDRVGYSLPGYPDHGWERVTTPHRQQAPGVAWYRTTVRLDLPEDQDVPLGLRFGGDHTGRYRATIFVNGWNLGQYINDVGPQRLFYLPQGILRPRGENTIAIAVWSIDGSGLGPVSLEAYGNYTTGLRIRDVASPGYDARDHTERDK